MKYRLIIFDFDGTLVDTITDVGLCFNQALRQNGFPEHPLEAFSQFVGGNLETVVSRMLPKDQVTDENITNVKTVYRGLYLTSPKPNTNPYPGVRRLLDALKERNIKIAINSNKGQALLDDMTAKLFPQGYFDAVVGYSEDRPSKPDPYGVQMILDTCGCDREEALYVGDGRSDIDTAVNAGIPCIFVNWGQGTQQDKSDVRVFRSVDTAAGLSDLLLG